MARRFSMGSPLGAWLDPIVDKFFLVSTFVVFALPSDSDLSPHPGLALVLTVFRDAFALAICLVMFLALGIWDFPPSILGKLTTFLEISTVVAILLVNVHRLARRRRDDVHAARRGLRDDLGASLLVAHRDAPPATRSREPAGPNRVRRFRRARAGPPPTLRLLSRSGCHLCEEMKGVVSPLIRALGGTLDARGRGLRSGSRRAMGKRSPRPPRRRWPCRGEGA